MTTCEWCGRRFPDGEGYRGGPRWNRRYYCSRKCLLEGENNLSSADETEDNLSVFQRAGRWLKDLVITVVVIIVIIILIGLIL